MSYRIYKSAFGIGFAIAIIVMFTGVAQAATITVDDDGTADYTSIQAAINVANSGDTIEVHSGTYYENVDVNKRLTIRSVNGAEATIVDANNIGYGFFVTADFVNISGFSVTRARAYGICLWYADSCNITNNTYNSNVYGGVYLGGSNYNTLINNIVSNNFYGIPLDSSSHNTLINNTVSNNKYGLYLQHSSHNTLINNILSNNWHAIDIHGANNNKIFLNNFISNTNNVYFFYSVTNIWNSTSSLTYTYRGSTHINHLGNYWDNYAGSDANNDGIGDTPYYLSGDSDDNYPLMEPWENYIGHIEIPDLTVSPESWDFGSITEGSQPQQTFTITNDGNADLVINDITPSCLYISISDISLTATITPDSSENFTATVDTTGLSGSIAEIITINSNDPDEGTVDIGVSGNVGLPDPPDPVYNFHAYPNDEKVTLRWNNPSSALFKGTKIIYKTDGYPSTPLDGNLVCDREKNPSSPDNCFFENVDYNTPYYFTAFSYDHYGQYSNGATLLLRYIPGIPPYDEEDFDGTKLCAPVASARILGYWDDRGYDKLVDGSSSSMDDVKTLVNDLKTAQLWTKWFGTQFYFARKGLALVCNFPTYGNNYCFDVRHHDSVSWEFLKSEIDAGRPLLYWSKGEPYLEEHITHVSGYTEIGLIGGGVDERRFIDALEGSEGDQLWKEELPDKLIIIIPASCAGGLKIFGLSPIDLIVSDPEGLIINNQIDEIPGALYAEDDINGDSDPDDLIIIPNRKTGDYIITVTQESGASLTDTYTLKVSAGDTTIVLAEDVPISDIPAQPYIIESTEEGIEDKTPPAEPIPEFTTIAIPVAAILGLVFLFRRRRHKR